MEVVMIIGTLGLAIIQFVYASRLMKLRLSTSRILLDFIEKERTNLGEKDYKQLVNRYSGVTRLFESFPDKESYSVLYSNAEFESFVTKTKAKTKHYLIVTVTGFIILAVIAALLENKPVTVPL